MPRRRQLVAWAQTSWMTQSVIGADQPGALGEQDEPVRRHRAAAGRLPADQRLDGAHRA
jgi:hypothetical protein